MCVCVRVYVCCCPMLTSFDLHKELNDEIEQLWKYKVAEGLNNCSGFFFKKRVFRDGSVIKLLYY